MKVIIVGGGIGGLTTALCCLHHGHDVTVLEKASQISEVGAGLQISPNAMKVFEALGGEDLIAQNAFRPEAIEARMGVSGRTVFTIPLAEASVEQWGSPYYHIHRADYVAALQRAVTAKALGAIRVGCEVVGYSQNDNGVIVELASGERVTGDVLVGADGIHSHVREQMLGDDAPEFTGNVAWRAVVPIETLGDLAPAPTACVWMGKGRHCVTYRLRGGRLANFVGVVERDDWREESWTEEGTRQAAMNDFSGWHPTLTAILENADSLYRWALFDRKPFKTWVDGRVALLGDACHPMLPFMAQGAAMAVEDAWVLAASLSKSDTSVACALQAYQSIRFERTRKVQAQSRANAKTFHKSTLPSQILTYGPMWLAAKVAPQIVHHRNDWIYGYDVTKLSV